MAEFVKAIIGLTIAITMFASIYMGTVKTTNTDTWSTQEVALWGIMGTVGIAGMLYAAAGIFGLA